MYPVALSFWFILSQLVNIVEDESIRNRQYRPELLYIVVKSMFRKRLRRSTRKSICFVNDSLGGGGAEQILLNVSDALVERNYDVTVLTLCSGGKLEKRLNPKVALETLDPFDFGFLKRVIYWVNRNYMPKRFYNFLFLNYRYDYTVAFLEGLSTKLVAETHTYEKNQKYAWVHIDLKKQNWVLPFYSSPKAQILSYSTFDRIFCVSDDVRKAFVDVIGYEEKTYVQYNLVDTRGISEKALLPCPIERPSKGVLLCTIGRLNPQKGYDRLIRVISRLIHDGIDCTLWILGDGALHADLEKQIKMLKLQEYVKLLGFQDNPFCYALQADIFVCSSLAEGYSTVITENLVLGKPIVSTLCAGVKEQLGNSEFGIVAENSEDSLYEGLYRMISDRELRKYYSIKALARGKEVEYNTILKQYLKIFC